MERGRADTIVASAPFVRQVDAIQYSLGEGPCISAATEGRTFSSGSLGGAPMWPHFGPRVGRLGVHSVLSLPLKVPDVVVGAIDQAIGIMISRSGGTADEAIDTLRGISQKEQRKLSSVAHQIVDDATRRARARHVRP